MKLETRAMTTQVTPNQCSHLLITRAFNKLVEMRFRLYNEQYGGAGRKLTSGTRPTLYTRLIVIFKQIMATAGSVWLKLVR